MYECVRGGRGHPQYRRKGGVSSSPHTPRLVEEAPILIKVEILESR
jgi:hypothetical protein